MSEGSGFSGNSRLPVRVRTLAILVMVVGLGGFIFSRLRFGDNLLCLFGSTLVTLLGLGLLVAARRRGWDKIEPVAGRQAGAGGGALTRRGRMPPGLRSPSPSRPPVQTPAPGSWTEPAAAAPPEAPPPRPGPLQQQVMEILESQGARVSVEQQRPGRSILGLQTPGGEAFIVLVLEETGMVGLPDVRALVALVKSAGAARGYLVTGGGFTPQAYAWVGSRSIRLVPADELEELGI